jgi:hypothetical protein
MFLLTKRRLTQKYPNCKSGAKKYGNKKAYSIHTIQNHTSASVERDTSYNCNNMKQVEHEWKMK